MSPVLLIAIILILIYFFIPNFGPVICGIGAFSLLYLIDNKTITGGNDCDNFKFQRYITKDWPRLKYKRRTGEYKVQLHWGQRKLLLSEIEFLTLYTLSKSKPSKKSEKSNESKKWIVVYAGAADGRHDIYLSTLFHNCEFHLYDPATFDKNLVEYATTHNNIKIFNEYFTDEIAASYKDKENILFICDIRTVPEGFSKTVKKNSGLVYR
jgi:hypothetical protein